MAGKPVKETVNKGITRYFTKDGREVTEEEYYGKAIIEVAKPPEKPAAKKDKAANAK